MVLQSVNVLLVCLFTFYEVLFLSLTVNAVCSLNTLDFGCVLILVSDKRRCDLP